MVCLHTTCWLLIIIASEWLCDITYVCCFVSLWLLCSCTKITHFLDVISETISLNRFWVMSWSNKKMASPTLCSEYGASLIDQLWQICKNESVCFTWLMKWSNEDLHYCTRVSCDPKTILNKLMRYIFN